jgi:glycosyltransferase involved in cell wall biosynthesis
MLMRKKYIIRTGGDFLWESYVERTGDLVLLREFYSTRFSKLNSKERTIFKWGGAALRKASLIIYSTDWQRKIFAPVYKIEPNKTLIIENYCGPRSLATTETNRVFIGGTRSLKWKNLDLLKRAFEKSRNQVKTAGLPDIELDCGKAVYDSFVDKIRQAYAVILVSLGDISPNMIFDAISTGTPFILTKETGIAERVASCAIFVDPQNENEIAAAITRLADPKNRNEAAAKVKAFNYSHTWQQIADEILAAYKKNGGK